MVRKINKPNFWKQFATWWSICALKNYFSYLYSPNGVCQNMLCVCEDNYGSIDCSISIPGNLHSELHSNKILESFVKTLCVPLRIFQKDLVVLGNSWRFKKFSSFHLPQFVHKWYKLVKRISKCHQLKIS